MTNTTAESAKAMEQRPVGEDRWKEVGGWRSVKGGRWRIQ